MTTNKDTYEHLPGVLKHKILEKVSDVAPVTEIELHRAALETGALNETIATFSQLNIPKTGLNTLMFLNFYPILEERLSEMVLD